MEKYGSAPRGFSAESVWQTQLAWDDTLRFPPEHYRLAVDRIRQIETTKAALRASASWDLTEALLFFWLTFVLAAALQTFLSVRPSLFLTTVPLILLSLFVILSLHDPLFNILNKVSLTIPAFLLIALGVSIAIAFANAPNRLQDIRKRARGLIVIIAGICGIGILLLITLESLFGNIDAARVFKLAAAFLFSLTLYLLLLPWFQRQFALWRAAPKR